MRIELTSESTVLGVSNLSTRYRVDEVITGFCSNRFLWIHISNVRVYGSTVDLLIHHGGPGSWCISPSALKSITPSTFVASCYSGRCQTNGIKFLFPMVTTPLWLDATELASCAYGTKEAFEIYPVECDEQFNCYCNL